MQAFFVVAFLKFKNINIVTPIRKWEDNIKMDLQEVG
jgi:hypothetical protein